MVETKSRPVGLAIWLIVAGVIGWFAAFELTIERFHLLMNPDAQLNCDFSLLVQCSANLESPQGSLFGFPNPILGLTGWVAPIVVGAAILAGARFNVWFWRLFWLGIAGAMTLVIWLIGQSIFVLGTLCPWCMVTWAVTIPTFFAVTLHLMRSGGFGKSSMVAAIGRSLFGWLPLLIVGAFAIIAVLAQIRLDVIGNLLG